MGWILPSGGWSPMLSTPSNKKVLALVDCNSFYCSCERLFAPHLEKKPVVVLSNNDGCVVSRTDEAKALGIPMGVPYFKIRDFVQKHQVAVFSSNYALYGDISARIMKVLSQFTPEIEVYSIDEAFLDLTGFSNLQEYGLKIREMVKKLIGIPVSIGMAPTKVLAKVANRIAKKKNGHGGIFDLNDPQTQDSVLETIDVQDIWGIGYKSAEKLNRIKIKTAKDLRDANEHTIQKLLTVVGRRIVRELRGELCLPLELLRKDRKQIVCGRGFGKPVFELEEIKEALANYVTLAAERLRKQKSVCGTVQVILHTNPFKNTTQYFNQASITLLTGTSSTNTLIRAASMGLERIYQQGFEYKKVGVILINLCPANRNQMDLLSYRSISSSDSCMEAIDKINARMGGNALKFGACGTNDDWKMLAKLKSRCYTTKWNEILAV